MEFTSNNMTNIAIPNTATVLAFTGHRPNKDGYPLSYNPNDERSKEIRYLLHLLMLGVTQRTDTEVWAVTGGALGFDTLAGLAANDTPELKHMVAIPFWGQWRRWGRESVNIYQNMVNSADGYRIVDVHDRIEPPNMRGEMPYNHVRRLLLHRNDHMIRLSSGLIAFWDGGTTGGTAHCVRRYDQIKGEDAPRLVINPKTLTITTRNWPWTSQ